MLTPWLNDGLITVPYVTVPEFRNAPTFLDSSNLIAGGSQAQQDSELFNVLLRASAWVDNYCEQRLGAHVVVEQTRAEMDRYGQVYLHPKNTPVRSMTALAYGSNFQNLSALTDLTQVWIEDARGIVVSVIPMRGSWSGTLEFGGPVPNSPAPVYVEYQYVAGFACTTLAATVASGATSLTVADPTGIQPQATSAALGTTLSGSTLRIWDPAQEEAVTVASGYTAGNASIPLTAGLTYGHIVSAGPAGQVGISEMPPEVKQAVMSLAIALLAREDVADEPPFAGAPYGPSVRRSDAGGKAGGLVDAAWMLLDPYRRVR